MDNSITPKPEKPRLRPVDDWGWCCTCARHTVCASTARAAYLKWLSVTMWAKKARLNVD